MFPLPESGSDLWISDSDFAGQNKSLYIRGLTPQFSYPKRNSLFYSLNATSVHNYPYYSVVYFENQNDCFRVIRELHQRVIFTTSQPDIDHHCTSRLKVEFVHKNVPFDDESKEKVQIPLLRPLNSNYLHTSPRQTAFKIQDSEKFNFPEVSLKIAKRISDIILNDKTFYHDVLLLMIQHNLKPPFNDEKNENTCNDEFKNNLDIPTSYKPYYSRLRTTKRLECDSLSKGTKKIRTLQENGVFETLNLKPRNFSKIIFDIPLPKSSFPNDHSDLSKEDSNEAFGTLSYDHKNTVITQKVPTASQFDLKTLSPSDLFSDMMTNRISKQEWSLYPVFNNYHQGEPSQSLYIKNLNPRKVNLRDLYCVYANFIDLTDQSQCNSFDIILLKSGKLRGQAFVSFPNEEIASNALEMSNGYILLGKPMVVCFSRNKKKIIN